jgi:hypothetical protein
VALSRCFLARLILRPWRRRRRSSETSVNFQRTTRSYIPEDSSAFMETEIKGVC